MKLLYLSPLAVLLSCATSLSVLESDAIAVNPVGKVLSLLSDLEAKISKEGDAEEKAFADYMEYCKDGAKDLGFEIKTAKMQMEDLTATIGKSVADIDASATKVEELAGAISTDEADLKAATDIRTKENKEFVAVEEELVDTVDTLDRAINVLEKKLKSSSSAALLQAKFNSKNIKNMMSALDTVITAASLNLHDKQKLMSLAQSQGSDEDDDDDMGAPAAEAYKSKSGSIIDILEDMREKAETQLAEARKEESAAKHNFQMLKQSLTDQIDYDSKEMAEAKAAGAAATETKAVAEGDLAVTKKDLATDEDALANMDSDCQSKKDDHETSVAGRAEELKALAAAKKAISSMTGGAEGQVYGAASFLQVDGETYSSALRLSNGQDLANFEVVNLVRQLAKKEKSAALMQLAGRIQAVIRYGSGTKDPFAKVKSMISDMIGKLESEAKSEASHKEYCDKELGESKAKMEELSATISKNTAKKDKQTATSVKLKGEVKELQAELATISKLQGELDSLRREESKTFIATKADLTQGLEGVRMALKVLREYYASDEAAAAAALLQGGRQPSDPGVHSKASGAGSSIIGMLEVIESDFGKSLASAEVDEDAAATEYEKTTMMNKLTKAEKGKDVEYKSKEAASLDKSSSELASDIEGSQSELDAVMEYKKGLISACVAKPETYEERKGRREAEVAGLKEALKILEGEALLQKPTHSGRMGLRGAAVRPHVA